MYPCSPHSCNRNIRSYYLSSGYFRPCPINKEEQRKLTHKNKKLQNKTKTTKKIINNKENPPAIRPTSAQYREQRAHDLRPVSRLVPAHTCPIISPCLNWIKTPKHPVGAISFGDTQFSILARFQWRWKWL